MIGAYITFGVVVLIVSTYMLIVHAFLRSAEEPQDELRARALRKQRPVEPQHEPGGRTQYAH